MQSSLKNPFPARFEGICRAEDCPEPTIVQGEEVSYVDNQVVHHDCAMLVIRHRRKRLGLTVDEPEAIPGPELNKRRPLQIFVNDPFAAKFDSVCMADGCEGVIVEGDEVSFLDGSVAHHSCVTRVVNTRFEAHGRIRQAA